MIQQDRRLWAQSKKRRKIYHMDWHSSRVADAVVVDDDAVVAVVDDDGLQWHSSCCCSVLMMMRWLK